MPATPAKPPWTRVQRHGQDNHPARSGMVNAAGECGLRRRRRSGEIPYVSTAQAALDCLAGNARMPAEGEALLKWMRKNGARWQTGTLARRVG